MREIAVRIAIRAALMCSLLLFTGCDGARAARDAGVAIDAHGICAGDLDCDDGTYCNGDERCDHASSAADPRGCVAGAARCPSGRRCSEIGRLCYPDCAGGSDFDGDGFSAQECGGTDCDDTSYGRCLFSDDAALPSGICTIDQCDTPSAGESGILPGIVVAGVCDGPSELCVNASAVEPRITLCLETCTSAASCAPGYACAAIVSALPDRMCWPQCAASADCRTGEVCRDAAGGACGAGEVCSCEI
jgi:hypothetical protein